MYLESPECAICFEEYKKDSSVPECVLELKCGHVFHDSCIRPWFSHANTCPSC
eukprot:Pgem_evm1s11219